MCVKACEGGQHHLPGSECIPLCRPLWGNRTTPTILWQRWPAGDISDSFDSARSCRNRKTMKRGAPGCVQLNEILIHHLTIYQCTSDRSCGHRAGWGLLFRPCRYSTLLHQSAASLCSRKHSAFSSFPKGDPWKFGFFSQRGFKHQDTAE